MAQYLRRTPGQNEAVLAAQHLDPLEQPCPAEARDHLHCRGRALVSKVKRLQDPIHTEPMPGDVVQYFTVAIGELG